jgi:hypothetical protein
MKAVSCLRTSSASNGRLATSVMTKASWENQMQRSRSRSRSRRRRRRRRPRPRHNQVHPVCTRFSLFHTLLAHDVPPPIPPRSVTPRSTVWRSCFPMLSTSFSRVVVCNVDPYADGLTIRVAAANPSNGSAVTASPTPAWPGLAASQGAYLYPHETFGREFSSLS